MAGDGRDLDLVRFDVLLYTPSAPTEALPPSSLSEESGAGHMSRRAFSSGQNSRSAVKARLTSTFLIATPPHSRHPPPQPRPLPHPLCLSQNTLHVPLTAPATLKPLSFPGLCSALCQRALTADICENRLLTDAFTGSTAGQLSATFLIASSLRIHSATVTRHLSRAYSFNG